MKLSDFDEIRHFSALEVELTGADIADVKPELIMAFDDLREAVGRKIKFVRNGLTIGGHSAKEHPDGIAGDCTVPGLKVYQIPKLILAAGMVGFRAVGIYRNGFGLYSFHFDLRPNIAIWGGTKSSKNKRWSFGGVTIKLEKK